MGENTITKTREHTPVLVDEVISIFKPQDGDTLLDATLGLGGHARAYLDAAGKNAKVIGLDADPQAIETARKNLSAHAEQVTFIAGNFTNLDRALQETDLGKQQFSHILFDLGVGSHQLGDEARGFSFKGEGSLNMLYSPDSTLPSADSSSLNMLEKRLGHYPDALDIMRALSVDELTNLIRTYGEERYAKRIAQGIKQRVEMIRTPQDLARAITESVPGSYEHGRIHPATRTFQALRIAVNRELEALKTALPKAVNVLKIGGIIAVISFHSLEDRIVKQYFRTESKDCVCPQEQPLCTCQHSAKLSIITKKPITAETEEINRNPRSRSAKLRAARRAVKE